MLQGKITSAQLAIWVRECQKKWESDEIELKGKDFLIGALYKLSFADWLDSVPAENLSSEADCSLSKQEAQRLMQELEKIEP